MTTRMIQWIRSTSLLLGFCLIFGDNPPALFAQASCFSSGSKDTDSSCSADFSGIMNTQPIRSSFLSSSGLAVPASPTVVPNEDGVLTQIQRAPRPLPSGNYPALDAMTIQSMLEVSAKVEAYDAVKDEGRVTISAAVGSKQLSRGMVAYLYLLKDSVALWGVKQMNFNQSKYAANFTGPAGNYRTVVEVPDAGSSAQKILAFSIESKSAAPLKTSHEVEVANQQALKTPTPEKNLRGKNIPKTVQRIVSQRIETAWRFPMVDQGPAYYHPPGTDPEALPVGKDKSQTDPSK